MKKIILIVVCVTLVAFLGRLGWAFWHVKNDSEISSSTTKSFSSSKNQEVEAKNVISTSKDGAVVNEQQDYHALKIIKNAPTATITVNGLTYLKTKVGEKITVSWSSTNADSFTTKSEPSGCMYGVSSAMKKSTAKGEESSVIPKELLSCTIKITYEAVNSAIGQKAAATAILVVVKDSNIPLPTASFTASSTNKLDVSVGEKYTLAWNSTNADIFYYLGNFSGCLDSTQNTIQNRERKIESTSSGISTIAESSARAGCTMVVTYVAENSTTGEKATAPITINVSKGSASETKTYIDNLIKSIIIMDSYGRAANYYDANNNSFLGVCTKENGSSLFLNNKDRLLELSQSVVCLDSPTAWAISARLTGNTTQHQCIDNTNNTVVRESAIITTSCK